MREVQYSINHATRIVDQVKSQIGGEDKNGRYEYQLEDVSGKIIARQVNDGLSCMISEFTAINHLRVKRTGAEKDTLIVLDFHVSEKASLKLTQKSGPKNLIFGAYFASADIDSYADFGDNNTNRQIAFMMDREWVLQAFPDYPEFSGFLNGNSSFFIYHGINLELASEIYDLHNYAFDKGTQINNQYISGQALKIVSLFIASFKHSPQESKYISNRRDIEELLDCRQYIHDHYLEKIELKTLVQKTSMSESKFRKQFKATFRKSPYEYVRHLRLWHAKELLDSGESVSQTAYAIGYANLSFFTRSFRETFGLKPSDYRKFILGREVNE